MFVIHISVCCWMYSDYFLECFSKQLIVRGVTWCQTGYLLNMSQIEIMFCVCGGYICWFSDGFTKRLYAVTLISSKIRCFLFNHSYLSAVFVKCWHPWFMDDVCTKCSVFFGRFTKHQLLYNYMRNYCIERLLYVRYTYQLVAVWM
jgi:hypothetical protein